MRFLKLIFLYLVIYIFLHSPMMPTFGLLGRMETQYSIYLLYIFGLVFFIMKPSKVVALYHQFKTECSLFLIVLLYVFFRTIVGGETEPLVLHVRALFELFLIPSFVINLLPSCGINDDRKFIKTILYIGCIGGIISTLCISIPSVYQYVRANLLFLKQEDYLFDVDYRGYGISSSLTYAYGVIQGVILAIGIATLKDNKWFVFFIPFILFSILFNARVGILVALVGFLMLFLNKKNFNNVILVGILIFLLFDNFDSLLSRFGVDDRSIKFLMEFTSEVNTVFETRDIEDTTVGALFGRMFVLPDGFSEWILGKGYYIFGRKTGANSDMGFILQLNYGGLLYILPLYILIVRMAKRLYRKGYIQLSVLFMGTFLIANIKGPYLPNSGMFRLLVLLYIYYISFNNRNSRCKLYS